MFLTLCDPMDCSLPDSSVHGIYQARILEWVAISTFMESFQPRNQTRISCISHIGERILYHWATWEARYTSLVVVQSYLTLCDAMDCIMPGSPVLYHLPEFTQTHVHWVGDAIQASHPLSSPSPPTFNLSQHQGLFQWVDSSDQVAKVLELQLQHQSFQWIFRTDFLRIDWFDLAVQGTLKSLL